MIPLRTALPVLALALAACQGRTTAEPPGSVAVPGAMLVVRDTTIRASAEASGIAAAVREAALASRLMGSVTEVLVQEGQRVHQGEVLARVDARDVTAKATQAAAGVAQAEAGYDNALAQARRLRALYADSAAPRAQLDDAEAGLARADAAVRGARGAAAEVEAVRTYAEIRAPFDGMIVKRHVDPGAFVAPGAPMITIQDPSRLRLAVTVAPTDVRGIVTGMRLEARIEDQPATAIVEGIVPASSGALYTINALIENRSGRFPAGASGTLLLPRAARVGILLPESALVHDGDMTAVYVRGTQGRTELRWLQVGRADGGRVEVLAGLRAGDTVAVPPVTGPRQ